MRGTPSWRIPSRFAAAQPPARCFSTAVAGAVYVYLPVTRHGESVRWLQVVPSNWVTGLAQLSASCRAGGRGAVIFRTWSSMRTLAVRAGPVCTLTLCVVVRTTMRMLFRLREVRPTGTFNVAAVVVEYRGNCGC